MSKTRFALLLLRAYILLPFSFLRRKKQFSQTVQKIVVFPQKNRIGDMVCATPVFRAIKVVYPKSFLTVVVSRDKDFWKILEGNSRIDEFLFYEDPQILSKLKERNFSAGINLTNYPIPSVLMYLAGMPVRAKTTLPELSRSERITDWMNTHPFPYVHHTYLPGHYLSLLQAIGIQNPEEKKELSVRMECKDIVEAFFREKEVGQGAFVVGISATAGNKAKEWGKEKFAELADTFIEKHKATVLFLGSDCDRDHIKEVQSMMRYGSRSILASFSLQCVPALIERLSLFVAVDTGLIYIAHALGVPLIDIVGPCDSREQPPHDERSICVLPHELPPSSFVFKSPGSYEERRKATEIITVSDVFEAFATLFKRIRL